VVRGLQFFEEPLKENLMSGSDIWLSGEMAPPARPDRRFEETAYARGYRWITGLDEAGRGPLAGPVVAAAVVLPRGPTHPEIHDSKLVTPKKRDALSMWIKEHALAWGLGVVDSDEIDRTNILAASLLAMAEAARKLEPFPDCLLIDGNQKIPWEMLAGIGNRKNSGSETGARLPEASCLMPCFPHQMAIPKGDRRSASVAAASIIAKVARDELMREYHRLYPEYGFAQHKGYASPSHLDALHRYGPSPIHRKSFSPIRQWLRGEHEAAPAPLFPKR
jgi:ribonuclease HII